MRSHVWLHNLLTSSGGVERCREGRRWAQVFRGHVHTHFFRRMRLRLRGWGVLASAGVRGRGMASQAVAGRRLRWAGPRLSL